MLLPVVATAVALGLVAPFSLSFAWRVPFGLLPTRTVLRSAVVTSLGTFLIGAIVEGCAAMSLPTDGVMGAVVGGTFMATLTWLRARRARHVRGTVLLAMRLTDPTTRTRAEEVIEENLGRVAKKSWSLYAELALLVVSAASPAGLYRYGAKLLERIPEDELDTRLGLLVAQALATCQVRAGELDAARKTLTRIDRPVAETAIERWLRTLDALLDALDGDPERALSSMTEEDEEEDADPSYVASRHLVRAHALAALERDEDARGELESLRKTLGDRGLSQALSPEGPASVLARRMAADPD